MLFKRIAFSTHLVWVELVTRNYSLAPHTLDSSKHIVIDGKVLARTEDYMKMMIRPNPSQSKNMNPVMVGNLLKEPFR